MNIIQVPAYFSSPGRGGIPVTAIAIHWMDGTLANADATFTGGERQASAHYGVEDGTIHQYVSEDDTAWSTGDWLGNEQTVSIEHSAQPGRDATDATYATSAALIADICTRHGFQPVADDTILPHHFFTSTDCPGTVDYHRLATMADAIMKGKTLMATLDAEDLTNLAQAVWNYHNPRLERDDAYALLRVARDGANVLNTPIPRQGGLVTGTTSPALETAWNAENVKVILNRLDSLSAAVAALTKTGVPA